jgi:hypothetical protein
MRSGGLFGSLSGNQDSGYNNPGLTGSLNDFFDRVLIKQRYSWRADFQSAPICAESPPSKKHKSLQGNALFFDFLAEDLRFVAPTKMGAQIRPYSLDSHFRGNDKLELDSHFRGNDNYFINIGNLRSTEC